MKKPLGVRKGAWTEEEDKNLRTCIENFGEGKWHLVPLRAGLNRCRKSCRLRWLNYLAPDIKRGEFSEDEVDLIIRLHKLLGNRWALIAGRIPGRTANGIKNYWNTNLRKKELSCKEDVKSKPKTITKTNILKPLPRTFSKNLSWLRGKGNASVNIDGKFGDEDICKPCSLALTPSDNNESDWWKNMLNDSEINLASNTNYWLDCGSEFEKLENLSEEEIKAARETQIGKSLFDQGQSCWNDMFSDVDLWNLINTGQEQSAT